MIFYLETDSRDITESVDSAVKHHVTLINTRKITREWNERYGHSLISKSNKQSNQIYLFTRITYASYINK